MSGNELNNENISSSDSNNNQDGLAELKTVNRYKESLEVATSRRVLRRCTTDENALSNISKGIPGNAKFSVVLITLVDLLAASYEKDDERKRLLSKEICKSLIGLELIHPTFLLQQMEGLRAQYSLAFHKLVLHAHRKLPQNNASLPAIMGPDHNLVLSSTINLRNLYKLSRYKEDFIEEGTLGSGGFGVVFRAKNKLDNATYAVKKVFVKITKEELVIKILREVTVFAKVNHPNIVGYKGAWLEPFVGEVSSSSDSGGTNPSSPGISQSFNNDSFSVQFAEPSQQHTRPDVNMKLPPDFTHQHNRVPKQMQQVDFLEEIKGTPPGPEWCEDIEIVRGRPTRPSESDFSTTNLSSNQNSMSSSKIGKFWLGDTNSSRTDNDLMESQSENKAVISYKVGRRKPELQLECAVLFIQMDLCEKTLRDWLDDRNESEEQIDHTQCFSIFQQVLKAVAYLHENGILHRDIKPRNIFVNPGLHVKLGDFGLAKDDMLRNAAPSAATPVDMLHKCAFNPMSSSTVDHTSGVGTQAYASPEQLNSSKITPYSDMYSLGIVLYELYTKFNTNMERVTSLTKLRDEGVTKLDTNTDPEILKLVASLMHPVPEMRPAACDLIQDKFSDSEKERMEKTNFLEEISNLKTTVLIQKEELISKTEKIDSQEKLIQSQKRELEEKTRLLNDKDKEIVYLRKLLADRDASLINMCDV